MPEQDGRMEYYETLKLEYVWPHEFARFQGAEVCKPERLLATTTGYTQFGGMLPQTSLPARRRRGINEDQDHSEKDAKNGTNTRGSD